MQSIAAAVVAVFVVNVMEALRFAVADDFDRCGKLSTHAVVVWSANAAVNKNADRDASRWSLLTF
jgi:hypothetical protein